MKTVKLGREFKEKQAVLISKQERLKINIQINEFEKKQQTEPKEGRRNQ